ncbi:hypothetical protein M758_UG320600 [Ceratodon purpureus]|nr:hypothetical protein M758_UG320600 [Ceratodon purpureus]
MFHSIPSSLRISLVGALLTLRQLQQTRVAAHRCIGIVSHNNTTGMIEHLQFQQLRPHHGKHLSSHLQHPTPSPSL